MFVIVHPQKASLKIAINTFDLAAEDHETTGQIKSGDEEEFALER